MEKPTFTIEKKFWKKGCVVIGIDEVGRGAFAGPVVVGAVAFSHRRASGSIKIDDSKRLSPNQRKEATKWIKKNAFCYSIVQISILIINKYGITKATHMAFRRAIKKIKNKIKGKKLFVLVDGFHIKYIEGVGLKNQKAIIEGDRKSISIAAASIIAKVYRDNIMKSLHEKYPFYGFSKNKGYGTKEHQKAIQKFGLSNIHRKSFNLVKYL